MGVYDGGIIVLLVWGDIRIWSKVGFITVCFEVSVIIYVLNRLIIYVLNRLIISLVNSVLWVILLLFLLIVIQYLVEGNIDPDLKILVLLNEQKHITFLKLKAVLNHN
jgi:hypothetical protein